MLLARKCAIENFGNVVEQIIKIDRSILDGQFHGDTLLILAVKDNHLDLVDRLLRLGCGVNVTDDHGLSALQFAICNGHAEVANLLIERGADVNRIGILILAAKLGNLDMVDRQLRLGCDVNGTDDKGFSALQFAICNRHVEVVKRLLAAGANANTNIILGQAFKKDGELSPSESASPIVLAVYEDIFEVVEILLVDKKVQMSDRIKDKLMEMVVQRGYVKSLNLLIKYGGIDIDKVYDIPTRQMTSLMIAVYKNNSEMVNALIDLGAEIGKIVIQQDGGNLSAIDLAVAMKNPKMVNLLALKAAEQLKSTTEIYNPVASTGAELLCTTEIPSPVVSKAKSAQGNKEQKEQEL
jgi:ankyrin repeat protein